MTTGLASGKLGTVGSYSVTESAGNFVLTETAAVDGASENVQINLPIGDLLLNIALPWVFSKLPQSATASLIENFILGTIKTAIAALA